MTLWTLIPVDLTDPNWEASVRRGTVDVCAPDEEAARDPVRATQSRRTVAGKDR